MIGYIIGIITAAFIALLVGAAVVENNNWNEFAVANNCRKVGEVSPSASFGVGIGGNGAVTMVPITTPGKTGYACDDGVTYWR